LPPGLAASAITAGYLGQPLSALAALGGLAGAAAVLIWLLDIRLRAQYRGESLSEAPRAQIGRQREAALEDWKLPGLSPVLGALVEKDLRYLLRNTSQLLNMAVPLILALVFSLNGGRRARNLVFGYETFFPLALGYCVLVVAGVTYNSLGYDGPGVAMLLAAPVRFRDVLLSKNLVHGLLVSIEILLVSVLVVLVAGAPSGLTIALTLSGALFVILLSFAVGNLASLYFPKRLQFGTMQRQTQSGITALAAVLVPVTAMGIASGFYALCRRTGHSEWAVAVLLTLAGIAFVIYQRVLAASSGIAAKKRDVLTADLCKSQ